MQAHLWTSTPDGEHDHGIPAHQFSEIDYASVCVALLAGLVTIGFAVVRVGIAIVRARYRPLPREALRIAAGALSVSYAVVTLAAYASWDGSTRPGSVWASAPRAFVAVLLVVACALSLRRRRHDHSG